MVLSTRTKLFKFTVDVNWVTDGVRPVSNTTCWPSTQLMQRAILPPHQRQTALDSFKRRGHLRHAKSPFSLSWDHGICEATKDHSGASSKRRSICGLHFEEPLNWDSLRAALWCNWPSNAPQKDADPELRHKSWLVNIYKSTVGH